MEYFKNLGLTTTSSTLKSRIESGKELNGYFAKWDDDQTFIHNKAKVINIKNLDTGLIKTYNSFLPSKYRGDEASSPRVF